ncbi:MAG: ABC transporter permease [Firmicutes bacterium]|nr:ABC transporter permease [Bacillota bacterium]
MSKNKNNAVTLNSLKSFSNSQSFDAIKAAVMAAVLGLVFGFIVMLIANPSQALSGLNAILIGGLRRLPDVFYYATPLIMTGLAVGFAYKMGMFNIGASGQFTMGMFFAMYVGFMFDLPPVIHCLVAVIAGMIGGMIWGFIPGFFKAYFNVNEVITSIMFNYIGMYLVDMWVQSNSKMYVPSMTRTAYLPASVQLTSLGFTGSSVSVAIIFAILVAVMAYIVLYKTTFGYELRATGFNKYGAEYAGMNGKRNIVLTMVIAGAMAGIGGAFSILAPSVISGSSMTYEPVNIIANEGFDGIAVALLASSNPIGIIFSALFISLLKCGGTLASLFGFKPEIIDVVIAVIIYFSAFAMFMNEIFRAKISKLMGRKKKEKEEV